MEASLSFAATDCGAMPSTVPFLDHMHGPKLTHIVFFGYYIMSDLKYLNICGWSWPFVIRLLLLFWGNLIGQTVFLLTSDKENKAAQHPGWCSAPVALTTVGLFKVQAEKIKKNITSITTFDDTESVAHHLSQKNFLWDQERLGLGLLPARGTEVLSKHPLTPLRTYEKTSSRGWDSRWMKTWAPV